MSTISDILDRVEKSATATTAEQEPFSTVLDRVESLTPTPTQPEEPSVDIGQLLSKYESRTQPPQPPREAIEPLQLDRFGNIPLTGLTPVSQLASVPQPLATRTSPVEPESSALGALERGALEETLPTVAGLAGAGPMAKLGMKIPGSPTVKAVSGFVGGLVGMGLTSYLAGKGQDIGLEKLLGEEATAKYKQQIAADVEKHSLARNIGQLIPQAVAFRPSISNVKTAIRTATGLAKATDKMKFLSDNPTAFTNLVNVAFGAGSQFVMSLPELFQKGVTDPVAVATFALRTIAGGFLNKETPVGKALSGIKLNREQKQAVKIFAQEELPSPVVAEQPVTKPMPSGMAERPATAEGAKPEGFTGDITKDVSPVNELAEVDLSLAPVRGEERVSKMPTRIANEPITTKEVKEGLVKAGLTTHEAQKVADLDMWATEEFKRIGVDRAMQRVQTSEISPEVFALGKQLQDHYRASGNGTAEIELIERLGQSKAVTAGRAINAIKFFYQRLSPEGFIAMVNKDAKQHGYKLSEEQIGIIREQKKQLDSLPEGEAKDIGREKLLNDIIGMTPKWRKAWDWLSAYRYSNALSSPRSTMRNMWGNAFQNMITRPISLLGQAVKQGITGELKQSIRSVSDAVDWWHDMGGQWKNAVGEFAQAMKDVDVGKWTEGVATPTELTTARQQQVPYVLRAIPQLMNAQDKFFSTFIRAGEKQRLMRGGMDEATATSRAEALAEKYLFREDLGKASKQYNPAITQAINSLGRGFQFITESPKLGAFAKPFIMFIKTPTNVAKFAAESSPLGITRANKKLTPEEQYLHQEQIGRAVAGSIAMSVGGLMAMGGNTTWSAPRDPELKKIWYATGRKPYSVKVSTPLGNDKWVPMWYFGPFALAFAIPAAVAEQYRDNPNKLSKDEMQKLENIALGTARFIGSQTSLQGAANFFNVLEGKDDVSLGKALGFVGTQFIPASGAIRYVNSIIDPKFRRTSTFWESIKKDLPVLSKDLQAHVDPTGKPVGRTLSDWLSPYTIGTPESKYEERLQRQSKAVGQRQIVSEKKKEARKEAIIRSQKRYEVQ